jgi:hypothetical protein
MLRERSSLNILTVKAADAMDLVDELTNAVWDAMKEEAEGLDSHAWPELHRTFLGVFQNRVVRYEDCGREASCRAGHHPALFRRPSETDVSGDETTYYTFEVRQTAEKFVGSLAGLAVRLFRADIGKSGRARQDAADQIFLAVRRVLSGRLFKNEECPGCAVRQGTPERRIWGSGRLGWR